MNANRHTPTLINSEISLKEKINHVKFRLGINRSGYQVPPGLYNLNNATNDSPLLLSCNLSLSFDQIRSAMKGRPAFILVLNTRGVNVWCAAGKGSFSTNEIIRRFEQFTPENFVSHKIMIAPQLSAPSVSANEIKKKLNFDLKFGPVSILDLPKYLDSNFVKTPQMREIKFPILDRLVLIPVEMVSFFKPFAIGLLIPLILAFFGKSEMALFLFSSWGISYLLGTALFPIILPFINFIRPFIFKGLFLSALIQGVLSSLFYENLSPLLLLGGSLISSVFSSYIIFNFTGSTTFTSPSGVKKELKTYGKILFILGVVGILLLLIGGVLSW